MRQFSYVLWVGLSLIVIALNSCIDNGVSQENTTVKKDTTVLTNKVDSAFVFPEDWTGVYKGEMHWYSNGQLNAKIPMQIEIFEVDSLERTWAWRSTYDSTKAVPRKIVKDYWLLQPDSLPPHHFLMDEQNGIVLDMNLVNNTFYTSFQVASNRIINRVTRSGDQLEHEIIMSPVANSRETFAVEGKDTFFVNSLKQVVLQKAILKRVP